MTAAATEASESLPLVAHVVYRFDYGGLENGIVNLINATHGREFRHCVIALTVASDFRDRLAVPGVDVYEIRKKPGKDLAAYFRLFRVLRSVRPGILHTRNIGTIDCAVLGRFAGIPVCVHGEHGWDVHDIDGTRAKYRVMRRLSRPFVTQFTAVSTDLEGWLTTSVGISPDKVTRICNGVDVGRFCPRSTTSSPYRAGPGFPKNAVVVGSVLRFEEIKDPMNLVNAFISAHGRARETGIDLRLVMIGDGPLRSDAIRRLESAGAADAAWLPGSRDDVPDIMQSFDIFVLGSLREGISNTLLEAMASGLPAVVTRTGGNIELVREGQTGSFVAPGDTAVLASQIVRYARNSQEREMLGREARRIAERHYSLEVMIENYRNLYRRLLRADASRDGRELASY